MRKRKKVKAVRKRKRAPEKKRITVYRSSITGRTVTVAFAKRNPFTTERQRVRIDERPARRAS